MEIRVGMTCYFWNKKTEAVDSFLVTACEKSTFSFFYHDKIYSCSYRYAYDKVFDREISVLGHHSIEEIENRIKKEGIITEEKKPDNPWIEQKEPKDMRVLYSYNNTSPNSNTYYPSEDAMIVYGD